MLSLLIATITTSAIDSLNPVGITQQFVLQGLVKKRHHIWYFIVATATVNFIGGMLVYYGLAAVVKNYMNMILDRYSQLVYTAGLILGILVLVAVSYSIMKKKDKSPENKTSSLKGDFAEHLVESNTLLKFKSLNPVSLFFLGSVATICEIPTALPYFAFISIILNYELPVLTVVLIMLLYNLIYSSPLIILYVLYVKFQNKVDKLYSIIKEKMSKYSSILTPLVVVSIGIFLIYKSMTNLLG